MSQQGKPLLNELTKFRQRNSILRHDGKIRYHSRSREGLKVTTWKCAETVKSCCDYVLSKYDKGEGEKGNNLDATYFLGCNQK